MTTATPDSGTLRADNRRGQILLNLLGNAALDRFLRDQRFTVEIDEKGEASWAHMLRRTCARSVPWHRLAYLSCGFESLNLLHADDALLKHFNPHLTERTNTERQLKLAVEKERDFGRRQHGPVSLDTWAALHAERGALREDIERLQAHLASLPIVNHLPPALTEGLPWRTLYDRELIHQPSRGALEQFTPRGYKIYSVALELKHLIRAKRELGEEITPEFVDSIHEQAQHLLKPTAGEWVRGWVRRILS